MSDVNWRTDFENMPKSGFGLIVYDDGDFDLCDLAEVSDHVRKWTPEQPKQPDVMYPERWAFVAPYN